MDLPFNQIEQIARDAAAVHLAGHWLSVRVERGIDMDGLEALRITIVIKPGAADVIEGDAVIDTLVQIKQNLRTAGEERSSTVGYATEEELKELAELQL